MNRHCQLHISTNAALLCKEIIHNHHENLNGIMSWICPLCSIALHCYNISMFIYVLRIVNLSICWQLSQHIFCNLAQWVQILWDYFLLLRQFSSFFFFFFTSWEAWYDNAIYFRYLCFEREWHFCTKKCSYHILSVESQKGAIAVQSIWLNGKSVVYGESMWCQNQSIWNRLRAKN